MDQKLMATGQANIPKGFRDLATLAGRHQALIADSHGYRPGKEEALPLRVGH
jgi:hypothetical protein